MARYDSHHPALTALGQLLIAALEAAGHELGDSTGPRMLTIKAAAEYLGIGTTKFRELEAAGEIPKRVAVVGQPRWDRRELDRYIDKARGAQRSKFSTKRRGA
ncbi:helix-turn-helix transcriptional regulator [Botrimarina mediterranea]|uniref:helix-turn-helix transcriptional regulator n=1 Tax=Botrimarina mediterranea TaxID=2528022 RepID=UPI003AF3292D